MAINTLAALQEKRGAKFVEKFLDGEVIITEKLDTFRFSFEKEGDEFKFYKKDNNPINIIERTITDIWESAISEIPIICADKQIPDGFRFGLAYTPIERPLRIPYTNMPRYVLTDITIRKDNKILKTLDYKELNEWAGILCIGRPPVIYQGKLDEKQKKYLLEYSLGNYDNIEQKSMAQFINETIAPIYSKENIIEGIIIQSDDQIAQIPSYEFNILDEAYQKTFNVPRDYYDLFIINLNSVLESYSFKTLEGKTVDERYIEIINDIFEKFIEKFGNQYNEDSIDSKYLKSPQYNNYGKLNKTFIKNTRVESLVTDNEINESIYKIILSSLRKYKKEYGLLNESVIQKFNTYVFLVNNHIKNEHDLNETLDETKSDNIIVKELSKRKTTDIDNMRVIASIQAAFDPKAPKIDKGKSKCAVYVTDMRPFSNSQMENILSINKQYNLPVIIMAIGSKKSIKGDKFKFSDEILRGQMRSLSNFNKELIPAFSILDSWDLNEIFERCRPRFEPQLIVTDKNKSSDLIIQLYFEEEVMGKRINASNDFNIAEMDINDQLQAFRAIEDNDAPKFMELTPQAIHILYDNMSSEYRVWRGSILIRN